MYLGFLTVCMPQMPLEEMVPWAAQAGFKGLEIGCWPQQSDRDYKGSSIDVTKLTAKDAKAIRDLFDANGMTITSLAYYDNNLHPDKKARKSIHTHLNKVMDAAALLGVDSVGTFVGRDPSLDLDDCFKAAAPIFKEHLKYAKKKKIKLMIENCPMVGWQREGLPGNLMYSPENWEKMFKLCPDDHFGLNLDPSHMYWLGCDYVGCIPEFKERIFHVHAKDTEFMEENWSQVSIYGRKWWRYRMPGLGDVDWKQFISALQENGYSGVVSIEHEDPIYEGTNEKVKKGLLLGQRFLSGFVI